MQVNKFEYVSKSNKHFDLQEVQNIVQVMIFIHQSIV